MKRTGLVLWLVLMLVGIAQAQAQKTGPAPLTVVRAGTVGGAAS